MAEVALRGIRKSFGSTSILGGVDLTIADGEFLTLVGPSGCGKSTLLRIIAGLERQDAGTVSIGGTPVDHLRPHERKVAMVFQSYALYPHMTVFENMALPLTMAQLSLAERVPLLKYLSPRRARVMRDIEREVRAVATQLRIEPFFQRRPAQLSGGQRQRVALGRAMVRHPAAFLMDEPLSNLDAKLRVHMRSELAELHARLGVTMIYVTHDQVEAMTMADRLAVMDHGAILQLGTPADVYERPASLTVAQFIGTPAINVLPAEVAGDGRVSLFGEALPVRLADVSRRRVTLGVRPDVLRLTPAPGDVRIPARLRRRENLGSESIVHFDAVGAEASVLQARVAHDDPAFAGLGEGERVLGVAPAACHFFDESGRRLDDGAARIDAPVAVPARHAAGQPR